MQLYVNLLQDTHAGGEVIQVNIPVQKKDTRLGENESMRDASRPCCRNTIIRAVLK